MFANRQVVVHLPTRMWEGKDVRKVEVHSREGMFLSVAFFALDYSELSGTRLIINEILFSVFQIVGVEDGWMDGI